MTCNCQGGNGTKTAGVKSAIDVHLVDDVVEKYRGIEGSLITVLQKAQDLYGYLPLDVLQHIADHLGVKRAKIFGVATFYAQFRLKPMGKYIILLCQGTACHVNGSEKIETALCDELKINMGETSADGIFTLNEAACLGCCSLAPVMMINGRAYGPLTPDKARQIVRDIYALDKQAEREEVRA
jgi:NADH-quinone oxidoreductase subunit E